SDPRYLYDERRYSVEARRSQTTWTDDVRGVGESKRGRLGDPAKVSCGHGGPGGGGAQPDGQDPDYKGEEGGEWHISVDFHVKLDFIRVPVKAKEEREDL